MPLGLKDITNMRHLDAESRGAIMDGLTNKWLRYVTDNVATYFWITDLEGRVLFSRGGGRKPNAFAGGQMGETWGPNPNYALALERLLAGEKCATILFHLDNPPEGFEGQHRWLGRYQLALSRSGRPVGVVCLTIDITNAIESGV